VLVLNPNTKEVLEKAADTITETRTLKGFPSLADCIAACEKEAGVKSPATTTQTYMESRNALDELLEANWKRALDYTRNFLISNSLGAQSRAEGWEYSLREYVEAVADIQANLMNQWRGGFRSRGNGSVVFHRDLTDQERWIWWEEQRAIAKTGSIDVGVPTGKIEEFRRAKRRQDLFGQTPGKDQNARSLAQVLPPMDRAQFEARQLAQRVMVPAAIPGASILAEKTEVEEPPIDEEMLNRAAPDPFPVDEFEAAKAEIFGEGSPA
jgi:hypothetical protein